MHCIKCGSENLKVIDSRPAQQLNATRRRRECEDCGYRFTTFERMEEQPLVVVKKDGHKEPFDRSKVMRGLITATVKRNIEISQLDALIDDVIQEFRDSNQQEVASALLGERVLARLSQLDDVASIRFASVYKHFNSLDEFSEELKELKKHA